MQTLNDLLALRIPIIGVGDDFQLPPPKPGCEAPFVECRPHIELTQIHRQATGSPIIQLANDIRKSGLRDVSFGDDQTIYGGVRILRVNLYSGSLVDQLPEDVFAGEQIICGRNATRVTLNRRARRLRGFSGDTPMVGERLMSTVNSRDDRALCNGEIMEVVDGGCVKNDADGDLWIGEVRREGGRKAIKIEADLETLAASAGSGASVSTIRRGDRDYVNFAYAITAHKAQGSEWDSAAVIDESGCFHRNGARQADRWLYTAVTRASRDLMLVTHGGRK